MSRYINKDALEYDTEWSEYHDGFTAYSQMEIDTAPSIDIVRCSECVYCSVQNTKYLHAICQKHGIEFKPFEDDTRTHGCTWGERKGE